MTIAIVAATKAELSGISMACTGDRFPNLQLTCAVTGVGMVNTALHLTELLVGRHFDLIINVGIAGSFDPELSIGTVVQVVEDRLAWFGAENRGEFLRAEEMGLLPKDEVVLTATARAQGLPETKGITVSMAHGSVASIRKAQRYFAPQVESMEGAAFFRVCRHFGVKAMQIRAISNRVEPRDRDAWDIPLALNHLTEAVLRILDSENVRAAVRN